MDLAAVSINVLDSISNFQVVDFPGSDHLPIECTIRGGASDPVIGEGEGLLPLMPKLKWSDGAKSGYQWCNYIL
ncbi:hypothetical protein J6590_101403, partial [Homalodisca vitripennis]